MTTRVHAISDDTLDRLAEGEPDPDAIEALGAAQISKRLLLVKHLAAEWPGTTDLRDTAVVVLSEAQRRDRAVLTGLLGEPVTGAWAGQMMRHLRDPRQSEMPLGVEAAYLCALAATAAVRTGLAAKLTIHTRGGLAAIPALGAACLPLPDNTPVQVTIDGGTLRVAGPGISVDAPTDLSGSAPNWLPLRRLSADADGHRFSVALDDLDPFRNSYHIPAASRLADSEVARWQQLFEDAWRLLAARAPGLASELATGLRTLVPLATFESGPARSATVRDAFGSFGLTPPESHVELAIAMVHEFQHSKLSALLDLVPLHGPSGSETYFAPWRRDPRPLGGLFQGVYAFLAIADLWCALRDEPALRSASERGLARIRQQVRAGMAELTGSGKLTAAGERFTAGMRRRLDALDAVPVSAEVAADARETLRRNHEEWRRRNARTG